MTKLDEFYFDQKEPLAGCLLALRDYLLRYDSKVAEKWYYKLPCFFYEGEMFCYIWVEKKSNMPYIAFYPGNYLNHPSLVLGNRTRSKTLTIDPEKDLPIETINEIISEILTLRELSV